LEATEKTLANMNAFAERPKRAISAVARNQRDGSEKVVT
jgi:hypothetical protein